MRVCIPFSRLVSFVVVEFLARALCLMPSLSFPRCQTAGAAHAHYACAQRRRSEGAIQWRTGAAISFHKTYGVSLPRGGSVTSLGLFQRLQPPGYCDVCWGQAPRTFHRLWERVMHFFNSKNWSVGPTLPHACLTSLLSITPPHHQRGHEGGYCRRGSPHGNALLVSVTRGRLRHLAVENLRRWTRLAFQQQG